MKITRFVNGQKISKPLGTDTVIKNEIISATIDAVNRRLKAGTNPDNKAGGAQAV